MVDVKATIDYWLKCAEEDFKVMGHLYEKGDHAYCLFLGHLLLEKTLKALFVKVNNEHAPLTHSLIFLAENSTLSLSEKQMQLLESVGQFNIEARYPDKKFEFYKLCTKDFASQYLEQIKEFYEWLLTKI